jgi:hypothetical protein
MTLSPAVTVGEGISKASAGALDSTKVEAVSAKQKHTESMIRIRCVLSMCTRT